MNFLRQPIEQKLSGLLGMPVMIGRLDVAVFKGAATARDVTIGQDPAAPLLRIDAIRFDLAIGRALQKEIHVQSLAIERPVLSLVRRRDGSWNLPRFDRKTGDNDTREDSSDAGRWTFDLSKLLLVDGGVRLTVELEDGGVWNAAASQVLGEITREGSDLRFTLMSDVLDVGGQGAALGNLKLAGRLSPFESFQRISDCGLKASAEMGSNVRLIVASDRIADRAVAVALDAAAEVADLVALLPLLPALAPLRAMKLRGPVRLSTDLHFDRL